MSFFSKKKTMPAFTFDPAAQEPAVRKSICTGEMTAGFLNKKTGKFREWMLVDDRGLEEFRRAAGAEEVRVIY